MTTEDALLDQVWGLVPGETGRPTVELAEATIALPSAYRVDLAATVSVAAATLAAAALAAATRASPATATATAIGAPGRDTAVTAVEDTTGARDITATQGPVGLERDHALASFAGWLRVNGEALPVWADLSGRYATTGGRSVQIHANFPHHAAGMAARLGVAEEREALAAAISRWDAFELERTLVADGMICAAYRTPEEWDAHPHATATARLPLIEVAELGPAPALPWPASPPGAGPAGEGLALAGLRVLDCTRVLAGPVCGQTLAAHGADVLRVGAAHLPFIPMAVMSTGFGKRNAYVDLRTSDGRATLAELVREADVLVDAYRPGALAGHGFGADELARLRPGIVVVELSAFDWVGPWAGRRGFDSIIQTTTGLALAGAAAAGAGEPVHLPVQALDYATGFLAAFAAQRLVTHQRQAGGSWRARLSLLRTRNWLASLGGPHPFTPAPAPDVRPWLHTVDSPYGAIEAVRAVAGRWLTPPAPLGSSPATWAP